MNTNQQYHEENRKKAIQNYYNTSLEAKIRDNNLLKYQVPRLIGKQRGIKLFGESKSCDYDGNVSGGSNITYSAALNSDEYEKYRKQMLQRRVDSLQAMKEEGAPPPMVELSPEEGAKLEGDSLLDAILSELSEEGTVKNNLIYKYIKHLVNNIYFYDTNDFIKLLNIFDNFDSIIQHFISSYGLANFYGSKNPPIDDKETFNNIKNYIKENMKGENLDTNKRKILAKSTIKYLRLNDMEKALKRNERGRQMLQELIDEDNKEKAAKAAEAAAAAAAEAAAAAAAAAPSSSSSMFPPAQIPLLQPPPPPSGKRPAIPSEKQAYQKLVKQKALTAGITDQQDLKIIEKIAMDYLKTNNKTLTSAEIDALIASYASGIGMGP
jgi:hypothetical protein